MREENKEELPNWFRQMPLAINANRLNGNCVIFNLEFHGCEVPINYTYHCKSPDGETYIFRTEEDAEIMVDKFGWERVTVEQLKKLEKN